MLEEIWVLEEVNDINQDSIVFFGYLLCIFVVYGYFMANYNLVQFLQLFLFGIFIGIMDVLYIINLEIEFIVLESMFLFFELNFKIIYELKFDDCFYFDIFGGV